MKFCNKCGERVHFVVPAGDDRKRYVCSSCGTIHYQNPTIVAGTIPERNDAVLLCKRAIEPQRGLWTLPAGYLENGETVLECALRESFEEAGVRLIDPIPYALCNLTFIDQIYFFYRCQLSDMNFYAGTESLEVRLFQFDEIPWNGLAFSVIHTILKRYRTDKKEGRFPFRVIDIERSK